MLLRTEIIKLREAYMVEKQRRKRDAHLEKIWQRLLRIQKGLQELEKKR